MSPAESFDWPVLLRLAALGLRIPPHRFWSLSLREWRALTAPPDAFAPLRRDAFEALAARFPDTPA